MADSQITLSPLELGLLLFATSAGSVALINFGYGLGRASGASESSEPRQQEQERVSHILDGFSLDPWDSRDGFEASWSQEIARPSARPALPVGVSYEGPTCLYVAPAGGRRLLVGTTQELFLAGSAEEIHAGMARILPAGEMHNLEVAEGDQVWGWALEPGAVATFFEVR